MKSKILSALTLLALLATFVHATPDVFAEDAPLAIVFDVSGSMRLIHRGVLVSPTNALS